MNKELALKFVESFIEAYKQDNIRMMSTLVDLAETSIRFGGQEKTAEKLLNIYSNIDDGKVYIEGTLYVSLNRDDAAIVYDHMYDDGKKMEAIKHVRRILGCGLKDAKDIVEYMHLNRPKL